MAPLIILATSCSIAAIYPKRDRIRTNGKTLKTTSTMSAAIASAGRLFSGWKR